MESVHTMVVKKFVARVVEALPSWEVTKYYGRVCWFQLQCLKYRIETSETWFNLKSKYMPERLRREVESGDGKDGKAGKDAVSQAKSMVSDLFAKIPKGTLKDKLEKLRSLGKPGKKEETSKEKSPAMFPKPDKKKKEKEASKSKQKK